MTLSHVATQTQTRCLHFLQQYSLRMAHSRTAANIPAPLKELASRSFNSDATVKTGLQWVEGGILQHIADAVNLAMSRSWHAGDADGHTMGGDERVGIPKK